MHKIASAGTVASVVVALLFVVPSPAFAPCHVGSFVGAPYRVQEAAAKVTITYSNGAGAQPGGSVDYRTADATAKAAKDYMTASGTLTWGVAGSAGFTTSGVNPAYRSFDVPILQDTVDESNETFRIVMSHFTGCFDVATSEKTATVTITDDDAAPAPNQTSPNPLQNTPTPGGTTTRGPATTRTPEPTPTRTSPSPAPTGASSTLAASPIGSDGGLSGGALAGIVGGVVVLGGAAAFVIRRRLLS